jgi:drug/metabolite transporter (DMT)-like permease
LTEGGKRPSLARLYSLLVLMVTLWAINFVVARIVLREMPAILAASLRAMGGALLLVPAYFWMGRKYDSARWSRADLPVLLLLGAIGVAGNQLSFMTGYERTSTAHAAILVGLTPLMVLVIAAWLGQEKVTLRKAAGMAIALAGILVLQLARSHTSTATPLGDLFILLAAVTFSIYTVIGKRMTQRHGALTVSTFAYAGGGVLLAPILAWYAFRFSFQAVTWKAWAGIVYMAAFPSVLCYLIYYYALTYIPATRVSAFGYLQPVLALLLGVFLLGEEFTGALVAGGTLVVTGVLVTERG